MPLSSPLNAIVFFIQIEIFFYLYLGEPQNKSFISGQSNKAFSPSPFGLVVNRTAKKKKKEKFPQWTRPYTFPSS